MQQRPWARAMFLLAASAAWMLPTTSLASPRYAARYGQDCHLCHVDPSGGGLRTLYASQYIVPKELARFEPSEKTLAGIDPQIGENLVFGADVRTMHLWSDDEAYVRNFFLMQGDIYLGLALGDRLDVVLDRGKSESYEIFGVARVLPWNGYLKVGRFTPDYGWKLEDHTAAVREELGFAPPAASDVGVEIGIDPSRFELSVSTWNGAPGRSFDTDDQLAAGARGAARMRLGPVQALAGASGRFVPSGDGDRTTFGVFGYAHVARFTWVGELDWDVHDPQAGGETTALVSSHEVSVALGRGLDLLATYDFLDRDIDVEAGATSRFGGGLAAFLTPFARAEGLVRRITHEGPREEPDRWETVMQVHFLY